MPGKSTLIFVAILLATAALAADELSVREFSTSSIARPDGAPPAPFTARVSPLALPAATADEAPVLLAFPVAGILGQDLYVVYHVDVDPTAATLDFNCTHQTFDGHNGNDPYIASFREQDIGVPVFAALDGVVVAAHGGEPDRNTESNPFAPLNTVSIQHTGTQMTRYDHLRQDVIVKVGDRVSAGTQIGWVGSSGQSPAPHIHFQVSVNGGTFEPFAGPCRPGRSYWDAQPGVTTDPVAIGGVLSVVPLTNVPYPPTEGVPHSGTFPAGAQSMYMQVMLGHVRSGSAYKITLQRPNGSAVSTSGTLSENRADLLTVRWGLNTNLDTVGVWNALVDVDGTRVAQLPFTVTATSSDFVNHVPNAANATIDAVGSAEIAVCRAGTPFVADPDYDVVSYRYEWTVNGAVVRSVTSAARNDTLSRQYTTGGASISCSVTASDGSLQSATSTAYATAVATRRRAVGR